MGGTTGEVAAQRLVVERWLRRRGMPMAVRHDRTVLQRSVPVLVFWLSLKVTYTIIATLVDVETVEGVTVAGLVLLAALPVAVVLALIVARWLRRAAQRTRRIVSWSVLLAVLGYSPVVDVPALGSGVLTASDGWIGDLVFVVVVLAVVASGLVSILGWAGRVALRRFAGLGDLASRALPLLMIFTLFGFFTAEVWQAIDALAPLGTPRDRLWLVLTFFIALTGLLLVAVLRDESDDLIERLRSSDNSGQVALLTRTPVADVVPAAVPQRRLNRRERANLYLILFMGHAVQTFLLATVVFGFFLAFGSIAIDRSVIASWVMHEPTSMSLLLQFQVPVPDELIKVSMFLAAFSAMYFAAHIGRDEAYRTRFFEPLFVEVALTLAVRDVYLAVWDAEPSRGDAVPGRGTPVPLAADLIPVRPRPPQVAEPLPEPPLDPSAATRPLNPPSGPPSKATAPAPDRATR